MTSARKRRGKVIVAQTEHNVGISSDGVMRSTKRTLGRCHKATGKAPRFYACCICLAINSCTNAHVATATCKVSVQSFSDLTSGPMWPFGST